MADKTIIAWTHRTFNLAWGCTKVSPGCKNCYADTLSGRYGHSVWGPKNPRRTFGPKHWAEPLKWNAEAQAAGTRLRVFSSSMCDYMEDHPTITQERAKLWPLIRATPHLDWQLLTKRSDRIAANLPADWGRALRVDRPHVLEVLAVALQLAKRLWTHQIRQHALGLANALALHQHDFVAVGVTAGL